MAKNTKNSAGNTTVEILKTYKLYIAGKFPRTESGRYYCPQVGDQSLGNICLASRKDLRNAVVAARSAQPGWNDKTAYNRSQILYRIAEILQGRFDQFTAELQRQGLSASNSKSEVQTSIDRLIYYSGWCDKFQQVFSSVNPVASSHFNFSVYEATGVVVIFAAQDSPLLGLVSIIAPVIASGNTCVAIANELQPLSAITFAEVLQTSDVPGGVVNLLTGSLDELAEPAAKHFDVNAVAIDRSATDYLKDAQANAVGNLKRIIKLDIDWQSASQAESPYLIEKFCEVKTTWHPIEKISASGSGY